MKKFIAIGLLLVGIISCKQETIKTAYVNNTKVVSDFKDMKAAQDKWTKKNKEVRAALEQKAQQFQIELEGYKNIRNSMNANNRQKREQELMQKQQEIQREQQVRLQEIQQGSQEEIDSIIDKVEDFIKDYGKKNGYTYIFGETEVSNLLYAKEELDLTDEILEALNGEAPKKEKTDK
ncbi:OmpH family outer membrane protein [Aquimarina brevivitae]|uniref:Periplasmic chaperone for outer membrane proteins Skp n=1 Tax=Aquimarina brevivitae TaxID=323412 RepID=A0A4Q7PG41_9FLAO|nr:OmpH family outer membrane protein [Aquimarina brevivitae]RZS99325.1 periplasmic chaperone for outer membrane proteins Skp [Aquimarina brevivitae]